MASMLHHSPLFYLKHHAKLVLLSGIIVAVVAVLLSVLFPLEYRADAQVLIISKTRYGVDPYTVVRSAERVGENLAQVMKTNDFYDKVMEQRDAFQLDDSQFTNISEREKRKLWQKTIEPSVIFGTGVLNVSMYHRNPDQAIAYANAAANALVQKGWEYVGGDVTLKVVNAPVVTRFPARPNFFVNAVLGFLIGVVGMGVVVLQRKQ